MNDANAVVMLAGLGKGAVLSIFVVFCCYFFWARNESNVRSFEYRVGKCYTVHDNMVAKFLWSF